MILLLFLVVLPAQIVCLQHAFRRPCTGHRHSIFSMQLSPIDEAMRDLKQLSISEVRSLSKEYGLDESLVKAVQIKNLETAIAAMNVAEQAKMPSSAQTLKVSPLEKTVTLEGTVDSKSKYGLENDLDIGNVLKEQGVRIDDLMALRDSLMKGGFKFNDDDDDEDMSGSIDDIELSDDVIAKEFYGEGNEFEEYEEDSSNDFASSKGNIGSSKNAFDAIAVEAEKSASNKLKSKAIKEAKLIAKSEGTEIIKKTSTKKREIKTKPQNAESGYEKKVRMSDKEYNSMRQSDGREYKKEEMKLGRDDIVIQKNEVLLDTSERIEEDSLLEELAGQNIPEVESTVSEKSDLMQNKIKKELASPVTKDVEKVVYVKLKRRFDDDEEYENENENDNKNKDRSYDFDNLEDLDDRMDELYGELGNDADFVNTETSKISTEIASKSLKGSSSKDPIKWKNGRLVNEKDKFFDKIKAENSDSDSEEEEDDDNNVDEGEDVDESEENSDNNKIERKTIIKKSNSKKVTVELTGVTMKNMLEHLETTIGFDGLFTETNLRCFSVKPSINSALKVLRQLPLEWARKKIEYLYIQSKKRQ